MSAELSPLLWQRFFDANGKPLSGGLLYSYIAGGSTPLATYTDQTGSTPNTNPVVLDSNGYASVWLTSGTYKFVLQDSLGNTLQTVDQVQTLSAQIATQINVAGALAATSNLSDLTNVASALTNLGVSPFQTQKSHSVTSGQSATNLTGETFDGTAYTSQVYEYEIQQAVAGYLFTITSGNATSAATYTNNGNTYTVRSTISSGTILFCDGTSAPQTSGTLTKASGTGDATLTFSKAQALYTIFGSGSFQVQFQNGTWLYLPRTDYDNGTPHGVTFSVTQTNSTGQLQAAEGGSGDGIIKLKRHYFAT